MHILVVDPNAGFAALLASELGRLGHEVVTCGEGYQAYQAAREVSPDLVLVDAALQEPDAYALIRSLRVLSPEVRVVLIAEAGTESGLSDAPVTIQGILPRPFFLPELPDRILAALSAPLSGPDGVDSVTRASDGSGTGTTAEVAAAGDQGRQVEIAPEAGPRADDRPDLVASGDGQDASTADAGLKAAPVREATAVGEKSRSISRRAFRLHQGVIESLMLELVQDLGAAGALLTGPTGLLTVVGSLTEDEIDAISRAVLQGRQASAEVARILGHEQVRFEQSTTGDNHMVYAIGVHDAILILTVKGEAQLGLLRHRAREAAERIAGLCIARG